jgi:hypothetical protein
MFKNQSKIKNLQENIDIHFSENIILFSDDHFELNTL